MFKWTKEILLTLAKKCNPKQAFLLLGMVIFFTGGYFILDRILDYSVVAEASEVPDSVVVPKTRIIADAEYHRNIYEPGLKVEQAK